MPINNFQYMYLLGNAFLFSFPSLHQLQQRYPLSTSVCRFLFMCSKKQLLLSNAVASHALGYINYVEMYYCMSLQFISCITSLVDS